MARFTTQRGSVGWSTFSDATVATAVTLLVLLLAFVMLAAMHLVARYDSASSIRSATAPFGSARASWLLPCAPSL